MSSKPWAMLTISLRILFKHLHGSTTEIALQIASKIAFSSIVVIKLHEAFFTIAPGVNELSSVLVGSMIKNDE
jgi:hypothetical protein